MRVPLRDIRVTCRSALMSSSTQNPRPCVRRSDRCRETRGRALEVGGRFSCSDCQSSPSLKRHEHAQLGAGHQADRAASDSSLDRLHVYAGRQAAGDLLPRLPPSFVRKTYGSLSVSRWRSTAAYASFASKCDAFEHHDLAPRAQLARVAFCHVLPSSASHGCSRRRCRSRRAAPELRKGRSCR